MSRPPSPPLDGSPGQRGELVGSEPPPPGVTVREASAFAELGPELAADVAAGVELVAADVADSTAAVYRRAFAAFERWALVEGVGALPATPAGVAAYVGRLYRLDAAASTVAVAVAAIARQHDQAGHADPTRARLVRRELDGFRRRRAGHQAKQARALTWSELGAMFAELPATVAGDRDRAVLGVGLATGARRGELAELVAADVGWHAGELTIRIRRGKTDQRGAGRVVGVPLRAGDGCPVRALTRWSERDELADGGPLFRSIDRWGNVRPRGLSPRDIDRIVKRAGARAGLPALDRLSAHSLRRGCVTALYRAGVPLDRIARHVGHANIETTRRYIDELVALDGSNPLRELWIALDG